MGEPTTMKSERSRKEEGGGGCPAAAFLEAARASGGRSGDSEGWEAMPEGRRCRASGVRPSRLEEERSGAG